MEFVIIFLSTLVGIVIVQISAMVYQIKYGQKNRVGLCGMYSKEVVLNADEVTNAIRNGEIKKHLLTNSAEKYDSGKTLEQYRNFLDSDLMCDITHICEESYNG